VSLWAWVSGVCVCVCASEGVGGVLSLLRMGGASVWVVCAGVCVCVCVRDSFRAVKG